MCMPSHVAKEGEVVTLPVDNFSAINLSKNSIAHGRNKHIETTFHYLRELVSEEKLRLEYCKSENQMVDLLTKGATNKLFKSLKMNMAMEDLKH